MPTSESIAANVRAEMARRRLRAVTVANELGLSQAGISRRLAGVVPFTALEVHRLAQILRVPLDSLFEE